MRKFRPARETKMFGFLEGLCSMLISQEGLMLKYKCGAKYWDWKDAPVTMEQTLTFMDVLEKIGVQIIEENKDA